MHNVMTRLHTLLLTFHGLFLAKKMRDSALRVAHYSCLIQKANLALKILFCIWHAIFSKVRKKGKKVQEKPRFAFITVFFMICRQKFVHHSLSRRI